MKAALITSALGPEAVAGTGAKQAASIDAWRKVFDREQIAALARFRPVAGSAKSRGAEASTPDHGIEGHAYRQEDAFAGRAAMRADGTKGSSTSEADHAAPAVMYSPAAARAPGSPCAMTRVLAAVESDFPDATEEVETPHRASPAALQSALADAGDGWPLRKVHARLVQDGVEVWLRDARLAPDDAALDADIAALRHTLSEAGYRLARFTLNGIRLV